jgi:hypothetical protein
MEKTIENQKGQEERRRRRKKTRGLLDQVMTTSHPHPVTRTKYVK